MDGKALSLYDLNICFQTLIPPLDEMWIMRYKADIKTHSEVDAYVEAFA